MENSLEKKEASIQEITTVIGDEIKHDQLKVLLNKRPPNSWVKVNKYANNSKYIPIDKVELLLKTLFKQFRIEVIGYAQVFNSITCHVRVHYIHPVNGEWSSHDGVGGADVQVKSGSSASDLANINNNAVGMALPIAKSYAIKDACHHLGYLFGGDLNRNDIQDYKPMFSEQINSANKENERIVNFINATKNLKELESIDITILSEDQVILFEERKKQLKYGL